MDHNERDIGVLEPVILVDKHPKCEHPRVDLEESLSRAGLEKFRRI